jgi:hypothetical protein
MERVLLRPPFTAQVLDCIAAEMRGRHGADPQDTVRWLLMHNDSGIMARSIRAAWAASELPLRDWAGKIAAASAFTDEARSFLGVEVRLDTLPETHVVQQAPLGEAAFADFCARIPCALPPVLRQLAISAPGLRLADTGMLCCPWDFRSPLRQATTCLEFLERNRPTELGPSQLRQSFGALVVELATDDLGNYFVLDRNQRVYFFDHLECDALQPCRVSANEFVTTYFANPQCVYDDNLLGKIGG